MISIRNLSVSYFGIEALHDISVDIPTGCTVGIIGPNGAGKSTFIKSILGIVDRTAGKTTIHNEDIKLKRKSIAYVPQKSEVDLTFPITVFDTVLTGTYPTIPLFRNPTKKHYAIAEEAMKLVSIENLRDKQINNLSGGQLQRVFIARALAQQADVFFLDEPFVGIDLVSENIIVGLLKDLRTQGKTILVVHHDLHEVEAYFDQLMILNTSLVAFGPVKEVFTNENIRKAYGDALGNIVLINQEDSL